jgi:hypothetical protein
MIYLFCVNTLISTSIFEESITGGTNGHLFDGCYKLDRCKTMPMADNQYGEETLYRFLGISKYDNQLNNVIRSIAGLPGRNIVLSSSVDDMMPNIVAVVSYNREITIQAITRIFKKLKPAVIEKAVDKYFTMINKVKYRSKHFIVDSLVDDISDVIELSLDSSRIVRVLELRRDSNDVLEKQMDSCLT